MERLWSDKTVLGCGGAAVAEPCEAFDEAEGAKETANQVMLWSVGASLLAAGGLFTASIIGATTTPVKIQAAPAVGGMVLHGIF